MLPTVLIMLAPGWRKMMTSTAGFPFDKPAVRISSTESSASPISESRTGAPFLYTMMSGRYCSAFNKLVRRADAPGGVGIGKLALGPVGVGAVEDGPHLFE